MNISWAHWGSRTCVPVITVGYKLRWWATCLLRWASSKLATRNTFIVLGYGVTAIIHTFPSSSLLVSHVHDPSRRFNFAILQQIIQWQEGSRKKKLCLVCDGRIESSFLVGPTNDIHSRSWNFILILVSQFLDRITLSISFSWPACSWFMEVGCLKWLAFCSERACATGDNRILVYFSLLRKLLKINKKRVWIVTWFS